MKWLILSPLILPGIMDILIKIPLHISERNIKKSEQTVMINTTNIFFEKKFFIAFSIFPLVRLTDRCKKRTFGWLTFPSLCWCPTIQTFPTITYETKLTEIYYTQWFLYNLSPEHWKVEFIKIVYFQVS